MNRPNWIKWLWFGLFLIIFIPLLFWGVNKIKNNKQEKHASQNTSLPQYHYEYKTVNFSGEYGEIVYLPSGSMASFLDATESYCVINKAGHSECGERGQDISTQMGDTYANTELRFKSQNRKIGSLRIRIRNK